MFSIYKTNSFIKNFFYNIWHGCRLTWNIVIISFLQNLILKDRLNFWLFFYIWFNYWIIKKTNISFYRISKLNKKNTFKKVKYLNNTNNKYISLNNINIKKHWLIEIIDLIIMYVRIRTEIKKQEEVWLNLHTNA